MPVSEYERLLHTDFARTLRKPFRRAVEEYRMFAPGDHVAACISGGKDSMLLALLLRGLARDLFPCNGPRLCPGAPAAY